MAARSPREPVLRSAISVIGALFGLILTFAVALAGLAFVIWLIKTIWRAV